MLRFAAFGFITGVAALIGLGCIADDGGIILETDGVRKTFRDGEIRIRLCDM